VIPREHDGLRAGPHAELVEEVRGVIADGLFADVQALADVGVVEARLSRSWVGACVVLDSEPFCAGITWAMVVSRLLASLSHSATP
jgi:hypothetical protein